MKLLHIFVLLLVDLVTYTSAQICAGRPSNPSYAGARNVGRRGRGCVPRNMWHYDARTNQCRQMRYLGCAGNKNRWCTRAACQKELSPLI